MVAGTKIATPPPRRRGRPPTQIPAVRRAALLQAAVEVFAADPQASLDSVAEAAGTSKGALYALFPSRESLVVAAVGEELDRLVENQLASQAAAADLTPRERVRRRFGAIFEYARRRPSGFTLLARVAAERGPAVHPTLDAARTLLIDQLAGQIRRELAAAGARAGRGADMLATLLVTLGRTAAAECATHPDWDPDAVLDLITDFALGGLLAMTPELLAAVDHVDDADPTDHTDHTDPHDQPDAADHGGTS